MAFNFSNNQNAGGTPGGFSFGQPPTTTAATASAPAGFSFGTAPPATNLLQSALAAPSAAAPAFGAGSAFSVAPSSQPTSTGFSLSSIPAATSAPVAAPAATSSFSFGTTPTLQQPAMGGISLGLPASSATTSAPPLAFATAPATASATLAAAPTTSASSFAFGGGVTLTPAAPASTTAAAPPLGTATFGAASTLSLNLTKQASTAPVAASTAAPTLGAGLFGAKTATPSDASVAATTTTSTTTTATASTSNLPKLTYATLEAEINKWAFQLEEQENIFIHQATQVNAWDRLLLESGDKIANLNSTMEALKLEQHKLDLELDYIASQERELEDSIGPIESAVASMQLADPERQQTYEMAENLDAQTKQMANDLKKIINHLNIINKEQDENNPVVQVGRILNAHMNSLLWIHQTASASQSQMDEASKMIDLLKKELLDHSSLMK